MSIRTSYATDQPGRARRPRADRDYRQRSGRTVLRLRLPRATSWLLPLVPLLLAAVAVGAGTGYVYEPIGSSSSLTPSAAAAEATPRERAALRRERGRLRSMLAAKLPRRSYIVIDRTNNRLYLKRGEEVLLDATCSAGSRLLLREPDGSRSWVFDTPQGAFRVLSKVKNPVWKKPDWAFIEEGLPVPSDPGERIEYGTLGEFALHFGNGYMIHGTLYERLLGRPVTHGCIRLGRDDLRRVFESAPLGTPIYIY